MDIEKTLEEKLAAKQGNFKIVHTANDTQNRTHLLEQGTFSDFKKSLKIEK